MTREPVYDDGYEHGKAGHGRNPHPRGTINYERWRSGFHAGQNASSYFRKEK